MAYISRVLPMSVAYCFFDDEDDKLRTAASCLRSLLTQILIQYPKSYNHFLRVAEHGNVKKDTVWTYEMLWQVLSSMASDAKLSRRICLILDATPWAMHAFPQTGRVVPLGERADERTAGQASR